MWAAYGILGAAFAITGAVLLSRRSRPREDA
jgi:hypothetical protein